ncbi:hypothetical protein [Candidatus Bealeia paramacronuclearis]|uniref:hypothetical protein n=1 Tax=Candidatus Bealeia paramacronuclearis TaxID=1921001 RepID=UPI002F263906
MKTAFKGKIYGTSGSSRQFAVFLKKGEKGTIEFVEDLKFNHLRSQISTKGKVQRLVVEDLRRERVFSIPLSKNSLKKPLQEITSRLKSLVGNPDPIESASSTWKF